MHPGPNHKTHINQSLRPVLEGEENFQSKEHIEQSKEEVYKRGKYKSA